MTEREIFRLFVEDIAGVGFIMLEEVASRPKQGVRSVFKFGHSAGFLKACVIATSIPFQMVRPVDWQRGINFKTVKGETYAARKKRLRGRAQELFPEFMAGFKTVKSASAIADALLMAEHARRWRAATA